jgi:hypothetical protein
MKNDEAQGREGSIPLVGRREELKALTAALQARRSCLITGPSGAGKTRLIEEALRASGEPVAVVRRLGVLHDLLVDLAGQLGCPPRQAGRLELATTRALKPAVEEALRKNPRCVVLDGIYDAGPRMFRFLQQLYYMPRVCLIAAAKSRESLGYVRRLLWDPREEIALKPLSRLEALSLFDASSEVFRLGALELGDFRTKVVAHAQGNPGQIVKMCEMAGRPEYQSGKQILFLPLWIDALTAFL